ncbi:MAG: S-adenosylmethionine:tRNA ribosyltransferase-isomerase [Ferruginibacter sp.]
MHPADISILDYSYHLPDEKIALYPLEQRDASKLLIYKQGQITSSHFSKIADFIPANSLLVFNNSRVINARILFTKPTGAKIEIFCLEPAGSITEYSTVMAQTGSSRWKCLVGGAAKWKEELLEKKNELDGREVLLHAKMIEKLSDAYIIEFSWQPASISFAAITEAAGHVPLPPYIKRSTRAEDTSRYQTIFAQQQGSVAAPTAGLHFTEDVFTKLKEKNIEKAFLTLHVGAGTFKPVKAAAMQDHEMHAEYIDVDIDTIEKIKAMTGHIAAAGTTSLRTVETLYWLGVKALVQPGIEKLSLEQWDVYQAPLAASMFSKKEALESLVAWLKKNNLQNVFTQTQLLVAPGYRFRVADLLITNFHQPQSTLLLLVAAAMGSDWRKLYNYALENDFRFLSYGDGNLIFIDRRQIF